MHRLPASEQIKSTAANQALLLPDGFVRGSSTRHFGHSWEIQGCRNAVFPSLVNRLSGCCHQRALAGRVVVWCFLSVLGLFFFVTKFCRFSLLDQRIQTGRLHVIFKCFHGISKLVPGRSLLVQQLQETLVMFVVTQKLQQSPGRSEPAFYQADDFCQQTGDFCWLEGVLYP